MFQHFKNVCNEKLEEIREHEPHCVIRWSDDKKIDVILQKDICLPPSVRVEINHLYTVDTDNVRRYGTIIHIGSKRECESFQHKRPPNESAPKFEAASTSSFSEHLINFEAVNEMLLLRALEKLISMSKSESLDENVHHAQCASCGRSPMRGTDRYRCLECPSSPGYDLCGNCFEERRESQQHSSGHAVAHFKLPNELLGIPVNNVDEEITLNKLKSIHALQSEQHEGISCDGNCRQVNFVGLRFKCDTCPNYNLCENCAINRHMISKGHKLNHPLVLTSNRAIPQIEFDDIQLGDALGHGRFGHVFKAKWRSKNLPVACKVIEVSGSSWESELLERSFLRELAAYRELSGSYILRTFGYAIHQLAPTRARSKTIQFMIIMEFMDRGSLKSLLDNEPKKIPLPRKLKMAHQIAMAMRRIHQHGMIHRDIRPDNILVTYDYVAKIGDMGIARVVDSHNRHTQVGLHSFMPPEFFYKSTDGKVQYDEKLDIYTFGLTLNELFTETEHNFRAEPLPPRMTLVKQSPIFYDDIIARCLEADSKRRPSAVEIEKTLGLYEQAFDEIIPRDVYKQMTTSVKDRVFTDFYFMIKPQVQEIVRKFPLQFIKEIQIEPSGRRR